MPLISRRFSVVFCLILLSVRCPAQPRPLWSVPRLSSFDGTRWGDLIIGQTTFKWVQSRYETGKGDYDHSTALTQPKEMPLRVDLLWNKRGDDEVLGAITVRFAGDGPQVVQVERLLDPQAQIEERFYLPGRFEPWRVARFSPRGIAAFSLRDGDGQDAGESAPLLLLCAPDALGAVSRNLSSRFTPVVRRFDPHENELKRMDFGSINVDVDLSDDLQLPSGERRRAVDRIAEASAEGTMQFVSRGSGTYAVKITGNDRGKKGGTLTAAVTIEGSGPYGAISATGSDTQGWSWNKKERDDDHLRDQHALDDKVREAFRAAIAAARREAETSFARQMNNSGPPPLEVVRENQWRDVIDNVRQRSAANPIPDSILR